MPIYQSHGIIIPNIRKVVIWGGLPTEITVLWQEIGRASRDGEQGHVLIFPVKMPRNQPTYKLPENSCIKDFIVNSFYFNKVREAEIAIDIEGDSHDLCEGGKCRCKECMCCTYSYNNCT